MEAISTRNKRTLLVAKGIATSSKNATNVALGITTSNKKLLVARSS